MGAIREGCFGEKPARWISEMASARTDLEPEVVDLRDYALPLFDEAAGPAMAPPEDETALRWGEKMAEFDGYIFVTAEYNHGIPGVLKNALDHVYPECNRKPPRPSSAMEAWEVHAPSSSSVWCASSSKWPRPGRPYI